MIASVALSVAMLGSNLRWSALPQRRSVVQSESSDGLIDGAIWGIGEM